VSLKISIALAAALLGCATECAANELSAATTVAVREIRLQDQELIPQSVLDSLLPAYSNRPVSAQELQELAQRLTAYLVERGYVSSGVVVPDQKVNDGVVSLQVVAGRVTEAVIAGNRRLRAGYISRRLGDVYSSPLNVNDIASRLQVLEQDPRIGRIDATVKPGAARGAAVLSLDVEERPAFGFSVGTDNHISPNVGSEQVRAEIHHLNLTGFGDTLQLTYSDAEGFGGGTLAYSIPLTRWNTLLSFVYERSDSRIVTEPFASLDIEGDTTRYGAELRQPVFRSSHSELTLGLGFDAQKVQSFLLGEPFSFSVADSEGVSRTTAVSFSQEYVRSQAARVLALRSSFTFGIDALDASIGGPGDGEFRYWLGQAQWLQKLGVWDSVLRVHGTLRLADDTLPAYRKYALGGAASVRGYRENLIVRDNGALLTLEWSVPVARVPFPGLSRGQSDGELRLTPFLDYGSGWDHDDAGAELDIASAGIAVRWQLAPHSHVELQAAKSLIERPVGASGHVLQDDGIHFSAQIGW
jgi:hemolysin activation/secretion protein